MSTIRSIDDAIAAGEPLIDLTIKFIPRIDYRAATQVLNSTRSALTFLLTPAIATAMSGFDPQP
jgi:hypothetical protein